MIAKEAKNRLLVFRWNRGQSFPRRADLTKIILWIATLEIGHIRITQNHFNFFFSSSLSKFLEYSFGCGSFRSDLMKTGLFGVWRTFRLFFTDLTTILSWNTSTDKPRFPFNLLICERYIVISSFVKPAVFK